MLKIILSDRETIDAVKSLLGNVFGEDEVKNLTASFFKDVLKSEVVVSQATTLGMYTDCISSIYKVLIVALYDTGVSPISQGESY